jgi:ATP-dependent Lon protease
LANLPLLPLRDLVVFPHMVVPLIIGRARSRAAVDAAMAGDHLLFLTAQHNDGAAEPGADDLHAVGTSCACLTTT